MRIVIFSYNKNFKDFCNSYRLMREKTGKLVLRKSPKKFHNFKCDSPTSTIKRVEEGFKKLNLPLSYRETFSTKGLNLFSGQVSILQGLFFSNGKGETPVLAKASAYAELAERCSEFLLNRDLIRTEGSLTKDSEIIKRLLKNSKSVGVNSFNESIIKRTCSGYSLISKKEIEVPIDLIIRLSATNGLSAGNTMEEAIVHGACEIFERHCMVSILRDQKHVPTINLDSIKDKKINRYIQLLEKNGISVKIKDFSMNNRFPVIGVLFTKESLKSSSNILKKKYGSSNLRLGSHPNLNVALIRCFSEEIQGRATRL